MNWVSWTLCIFCLSSMLSSKHKQEFSTPRTAHKIAGKANGEAETKWCFTRVGHKMARPCVCGRASRDTDAAHSPSLCSCRWSRAAAHSGPPAQPCTPPHSHVLRLRRPSVLRLWALLNTAQEGRYRGDFYSCIHLLYPFIQFTDS